MMSPETRDLLIRTIIGEAGNESPEGQMAVANVIKNRAISGHWGPQYRVRDVVLSPKQFSTWNPDINNPGGRSASPTDPLYQRVGQIVDGVFEGDLGDNTGGATHYYAPAGMRGGTAPAWAANGQNVQRIGSQIFMSIPGYGPAVQGPPIPSTQAGGTPNYAEVGNFNARGGAERVDPKLLSILRTAASTMPGYRVEAYSGFRPGDSGFHGKGLATDIRLIGPDGKEVPNYQSSEGYRVYEQFAQNARAIQMQQYPELADQFRWGGYFSDGGKGNYGNADLMHFDLGGGNGLGMAGGSWEHGASPQMRADYGLTGQSPQPNLAYAGEVQPNARVTSIADVPPNTVAQSEPLFQVQPSADLPAQNAQPTEGPAASLPGNPMGTPSAHPLVSDATIAANNMTVPQIAELESARESAQRIQGESLGAPNVQQWGNNVARQSFTAAEQPSAGISAAPQGDTTMAQNSQGSGRVYGSNTGLRGGSGGSGADPRYAAPVPNNLGYSPQGMNKGWGTPVAGPNYSGGFNRGYGVGTGPTVASTVARNTKVPLPPRRPKIGANPNANVQTPTSVQDPNFLMRTPSSANADPTLNMMTPTSAPQASSLSANPVSVGGTAPNTTLPGSVDEYGRPTPVSTIQPTSQPSQPLGSTTTYWGPGIPVQSNPVSDPNRPANQAPAVSVASPAASSEPISQTLLNWGLIKPADFIRRTFGGAAPPPQQQVPTQQAAPSSAVNQQWMDNIYGNYNTGS